MDFEEPIPHSLATQMVNTFRAQSNNHCIIYKPDSIENYMKIHFKEIVARQNISIPAGYNWELSFCFMTKEGNFAFCVAPTLVRRNTQGELVDVLDCFSTDNNGVSVSTVDSNISYTYDYADYDAHEPSPKSVFDDGNMFP